MTDYPEFNPNWSEAVRVAWLNNYRHDPREAPNIERIQPVAPMSFANYPIKDKPTAPAFTGTPEGHEPKTWMDNHGGMHAAPADGEATVQAICKIIGHPYHKQWEAERIIRSVQRGEVPGLPSPDEHAALKSEVERLREDVTRVRKLASEDAMKLQSERDAAIARAEKAKRAVVQQDTGPAFVAAIGGRYYLVGVSDEDPTKVAPAWHNMTEADSKAVAEQLKTLLDARAAHAEAMELLSEFDRMQSSMEVADWCARLTAHLAKHQNKDASK